MMTREDIKNEILNMGAFDVDFFNDNFKGFKNGISFYVKLSSAVTEEIDDKPTYTYFHHYRTVNSLIDNIALRCGILIEKKGYKYYNIAASQTVGGSSTYQGEYSHKKAACLAGLGYVGKNGLLITEKYGSKIRLGTIFTDFPLEAENKIIENKCGSCDICVNICPAMALTGNPEQPVDRKACSDYMKDKFKLIGRGSVCGLCMAHCPKSK